LVDFARRKEDRVVITDDMEKRMVRALATTTANVGGSIETELRVDLAAAFRLAVEQDWHEGVSNHFSATTSDDGRKFLMNPKWRHFAGIKASDLIEYDSGDTETMNRPDAPDPTAWCIHGAIHANVPHARCILHLHPPYATALAALAKPEILPIDQVTARYYQRVAIDLNFQGLADDWAEGQRLAKALGNRSSMIMGNHGILVVGPTIAEAFDELYYLERACRTLMLAYASSQKLNVMSSEIAERTAAGWDAYREMSYAHFEERKRMLNATDASYAS
jgi:ribulose-5-phosphate 4-epimerase/fuculose-1-phosphate aldolase